MEIIHSASISTISSIDAFVTPASETYSQKIEKSKERKSYEDVRA